MLEPSVTVILVTYNSSHCLADALATLPPEVVSIVVDNGSTDGTVAIAGQRADHVLEMKSNLGFSKACNAGAAIAETEFLLMMNPDSLVGPGAISRLLAAAEAYPKASAFNPVMARTTDMMAQPASDDRVVSTLSGAALFLRKQVFVEVGGFDERFFLYFEDTDLSIRLAAKGALMEIGAARFTHKFGQSSRLSIRGEFRKYRHYGHSRAYFNAKHDLKFRRSKQAISQGLKAVHRLVIGRRRLAAQHLGRAVGYMEGHRAERW
jgi:N-acetylglucosaminyl-diphospho-decaprenol L-rhamnosyltransferase